MSFAFKELVDGPNRVAIEVEGTSYEAPCLLEDHDGLVYFVVAMPQITERMYHHARTAGAVVICVYDGTWKHQIWPDFEQSATHNEGLGLYTMSHITTDLPRLTPLGELMAIGDLQAAANRAEDAKPTFVNLHTHSEFSALDGLSRVEELVKLTVDMGQPALAITDHGVCAGHPQLQMKSTAAGIKPIFGLEAYFVNDRHWRPTVEVPTFAKGWEKDPELKRQVDEAKAEKARQQQILQHGYYHLILWAMTDEGLHNLWAMSSAAHRASEKAYRPRLDWEVLEQWSEGVACSTACLRGPLAVPLAANDEPLAIANLSRLQNIFRDRLYIELHCNTLPEQITVNHGLIDLANRYSVPMVASVDSHYPCADDRETHQIWLAMQTNDEVQDEGDLFAGGQDYHLMARSEVCNRLEAHYPRDIVSAALDETVALSERINASITTSSKPPIYSKPTPEMRRTMSDDELTQRLLEMDADRLMDICLANWDRKVKGKRRPEADYIRQFEYEMRMYIDKKFCGYFDIVSDYTRWSKEQGWLMGPSRGSGGACLVAYLADITEIDPIDAELPFARFMTKGRKDPPDFDLDWAAPVRTPLQNYAAERWGEDYVVRVGTHTRLRNKGVFRGLAGVFKNDPNRQIDFTDIDAICKIIEAEEADSAGLGKPWEVVYLANEEVFEPYKQKYPWLFELVEKLVGRLKTYSRHAAGMVISTDRPLTDWLPMRLGEDGHMISDFDMDALESLKLLKFDFLTLRTLETLQECIDLIYKRRGVKVDIYSWTKQHYEDPLVWEGIKDCYTMGLFQIETNSMTSLVRRVQPGNLDELADVVTLVRPGPTKSGLTDTYIRRKFGHEPISVPDPRLEDVLSRTYGCIIYQEDIINVCMILAGYDEEEADGVRKILGKKKVDQIEAVRQKFVPACVERGMEESAANALMDQMAEFSKYSFNRAHAYAYAVLCYWTAWFKFHYTPEFLTAVLSTVDKDRIPDFVNEARRMHFKVLPPDINESGKGFTPYDTSIRYALDGITGIGESAVNAIVQGQPYASFEDFMERRGSKCNAGHIRTLAAVGAFDSIYPNRHKLETVLDHEADPDSERCQHWKPGYSGGPNGLPCIFDWSSEPVEFTKTGKPKKARPLPTKCFKGCRRYTAPDKYDPEVEPYTEMDIQDKEMEHLGVWLSSTPFDRIEAKDLEMCHTADTLMKGELGEYMLAAIVTRVKEAKTRYDKEYAWVSLFAQTGTVEAVCWSETWKGTSQNPGLSSWLRKDCLVICIVRKKMRGEKEQLELSAAMPI